MKVLAPTYPPETMRRLTALSEAVLDLDDVGLTAEVSISVRRLGLEVATIDGLGKVTFQEPEVAE